MLKALQLDWAQLGGGTPSGNYTLQYPVGNSTTTTIATSQTNAAGFDLARCYSTGAWFGNAGPG